MMGPLGRHRAHSFAVGAGFTLIELMVVVAVLALIAAIAIPGIMAAIRVANERNASASLKLVANSQVIFKMSDADGDGDNSYWTGDVAKLFYASTVTPATATSIARLIEPSIAEADGAPLEAYSVQGGNAHRSLPKAGYWFFALQGYEEDGFNAYGLTNYDRFGFIAVPHSYGASGRLLFIISEQGTMYRRDPGSLDSYFDLSSGGSGKGKGKGKGKGLLRAPGQLKDTFKAFPLDPIAVTGLAAAEVWSKMD